MFLCFVQENYIKAHICLYFLHLVLTFTPTPPPPLHHNGKESITVTHYRSIPLMYVPTLSRFWDINHLITPLATPLATPLTETVAHHSEFTFGLDFSTMTPGRVRAFSRHHDLNTFYGFLSMLVCGLVPVYLASFPDSSGGESRLISLRKSLGTRLPSTQPIAIAISHLWKQRTFCIGG